LRENQLTLLTYNKGIKAMKTFREYLDVAIVSNNETLQEKCKKVINRDELVKYVPINKEIVFNSHSCKIIFTAEDFTMEIIYEAYTQSFFSVRARTYSQETFDCLNFPSTEIRRNLNTLLDTNLIN
jgi:hypothetical protein